MGAGRTECSCWSNNWKSNVALAIFGTGTRMILLFAQCPVSTLRSVYNGSRVLTCLPVGILGYRDGERRATRQIVTNVMPWIKPLFAHSNGIYGFA